MTIAEQIKHWGIFNPQHIGDGAYIGSTAEGIALFTSNGVFITRPVFLDNLGMQATVTYIKERTS